MKKFHYLDVIISPNITEKSTSLSEFNKVVFKVNKGASKNSIKRSIETGEGQTIEAITIAADESGEKVAEFKIRWSFKSKS